MSVWLTPLLEAATAPDATPGAMPGHKFTPADKANWEKRVREGKRQNSDLGRREEGTFSLKLRCRLDLVEVSLRVW